MPEKILLCTDLDRTLLPNGFQPESPDALPRFRKLAAHPELALAFVSGRDKALLLDAMHEYDLPEPDYAIGDVGTTIYRVQGDTWEVWNAWHDEIAPDWKGCRHGELAGLFDDIDELQLQEPEKQNIFKLSYYVPVTFDPTGLIAEMTNRLNSLSVAASLVWSVDEVAGRGLLDVLPARANKYHAIRFLMEREGYRESSTVFAGDSGNDLPVLTSGLQAVLVRNATEEVRQAATKSAHEKGAANRLYLARGGFHGMNGYYTAGVIEGLVHFVPAVEGWL